MADERDGSFKVLIAGGGVAGLEGLLAIRAAVGPRAEVEVLAPESEFSYRQLAVGEPFGLGDVASFDLTELIESAGGVHRCDWLAEVSEGDRVVTTATGVRHRYDALLLALGAHPRPALEGEAITYRGAASTTDVRNVIAALNRREISTLAFVVPVGVRWSLPIYELALLAAARLADLGNDDASICLVTHETEPLGLFGPEAAAKVRDLLHGAGIELRAGVSSERADPNGVRLAGGEVVPADRVIALPRFEVEDVAGVPQDEHGFIPTDSVMHVDDPRRIFAAGDATWYPIKQGGVAAQQADAAASAICRLIDPGIEERPFRPVLRAALLTGSGPLYLRGQADSAGTSAASGPAPLWWPPSKVAGRYLAPHIAAHAAASNQPAPPLGDLDSGSDDNARAADHHETVEAALTAANLDAADEDFAGALRWLAVAELLDLTLPPEYVLRRKRWRRRVAARTGS